MPAGRRVAVVTGGGRGIGRAVAAHLAERHWRTVVLDLGCRVDGIGEDASVASEAARAIEAGGGEAIAVAVDITDHAQVRAQLDPIVEDWGRLDAVINAAGVLRLNNVLTATQDDWSALVDVHLRGSFNLAAYAFGHWISTEATYGRLVNFTSAAGLEGIPDMLVYSTVKAGVIGMTFALANSAPTHVTVNAVAPTGASRMAIRGMGQRAIEARDTTGDWPALDDVDPHDVGPLIEYLLSDAAASVNGRVLTNHGRRYTVLDPPVAARTCTVPPEVTGDDTCGYIAHRFVDVGPPPTRFRVDRLRAAFEYEFPIDDLDR